MDHLLLHSPSSGEYPTYTQGCSPHQLGSCPLLCLMFYLLPTMLASSFQDKFPFPGQLDRTPLSLQTFLTHQTM